MDQMVRNDIACICVPIVRIAFRYAHISFVIAVLRILIAYLGCCTIKQENKQTKTFAKNDG